MRKRNATTLTHAIALLSGLVLLGSAAVAAGHRHEDEDVQHDGALRTAGALNPFAGPQSDPSPCLAAAAVMAGRSPGPLSGGQKTEREEDPR